MFACDDSFTEAQLASFKKYANAFFTGIPAGVEIMRAGQVIPGQKTGSKKAPMDFLGTEIESREGYPER